MLIKEHTNGKQKLHLKSTHKHIHINSNRTLENWVRIVRWEIRQSATTAKKKIKIKWRPWPLCNATQTNNLLTFPDPSLQLDAIFHRVPEHENVTNERRNYLLYGRSTNINERQLNKAFVFVSVHAVHMPQPSSLPPRDVECAHIHNWRRISARKRCNENKNKKKEFKYKLKNISNVVI